MYIFILGRNTVFALKYYLLLIHAYYILMKVLSISMLTFTAILPYWDFTDRQLRFHELNHTQNGNKRIQVKNSWQSLCMSTLSAFNKLCWKFLCIFVMDGRAWHFVIWIFECTVFINIDFQETGLESGESALVSIRGIGCSLSEA